MRRFIAALHCLRRELIPGDESDNKLSRSTYETLNGMFLLYFSVITDLLTLTLFIECYQRKRKTMLGIAVVFVVCFSAKDAAARYDAEHRNEGKFFPE